MAEKFSFRGVEFRAGAHLWSNPQLRGTPAEIPIILARPTLFDLVQLATRYPLGTLFTTNRRLRASREISERQFARTQEILLLVKRVRNDAAPGCDEVIAAMDVAYEDPAGAESTQERGHQRTLADWLPGGLPTVQLGTQRYIRLEDVPFELGIALRRWLRGQLDSVPDTASQWLIATGDGQCLSHDGWCAFLAWLSDALLHRLDQMEIGM